MMYEDDIASSGEPGLANFATSMIEPLEAQGRGFAHGHKKVTGLPSVSVRKLKEMFAKSEDALSEFLDDMREQVLRAASSIQYDSATLPARQCSQVVPDEPFSKKQQMQSRLDGGLEADGITSRQSLECQETEPKGHVRRERERAENEQRGARSEWSQVPLTGCQQCMMPNYRQRTAFGSIAQYSVDAHGACCPGAELPSPNDDPHLSFKVDDSTGEVHGFLLPDGSVASFQDLLEDAKTWSRSYANDVRSLHTQNHNHNCTATCVKYATAKQQSSLAADKVPACRFFFFHIVEVEVEENGRKVTKRFMRRGKQLVRNAHIATTNHRNEFGRAVPERTHPFTSSSSDLLQAALRCNADVQFMDRAVPKDMQCLCEDQEATSEDTEKPSRSSRILYGVLLDTGAKKTLMFSFKAASKAGFVCDFYMTKYAAKAQQVLSSALAPLIQGLRRFELEEAEDGEKPERERAIAKLRRLMFSANRCHWFSATELALYVMTGGHCISTHSDQVMFIARPQYMMQECKRRLNGETSTRQLDSTVVPDIFVSNMCEKAAQVNVCAEHAEPSTDEDLPSEESQATGAAADLNSGAAIEPCPADEEHIETQEIQVLQATTTNRDDWLHRGRHLLDITWDCYVQNFERLRKPRDVSRRKNAASFFPFEEHYALYDSYCQRLRDNPRVIPRFVGAACAQRHIDNGEPNALFKATLFTPLRCLGPEYCADPSHCQPAVSMPAKRVLVHRPQCEGPTTISPGNTSAHHGRRLLCRCADHQCSTTTRECDTTPANFRLAWKARRAHIEVLAEIGQKKLDREKRIAVIRDCTCFKKWELSSPGVNSVLKKHLLGELLSQRASDQPAGELHVHLARPLEKILLFSGLQLGYHPDQLHLVTLFVSPENLTFSTTIIKYMLPADSRSSQKSFLYCAWHTRPKLENYRRALGPQTWTPCRDVQAWAWYITSRVHDYCNGAESRNNVLLRS